jgi:spore coat protein U-like protein
MFMKKVSARLLTVASATALILGVSSGTQAASPQNADLNVSATVEANCTIATTAVDFGAYDPIVTNLSTDLDAQGEVTVLCTNGASATVTLGQGVDPGPGSTDAAPARRLKHSTADYLTYILYSDGGHSTVWGNTAGTGVSHTGTGLSTDLHVYGRLAAGQNKPVGTYTDTVVASVTF